MKIKAKGFCSETERSLEDYKQDIAAYVQAKDRYSRDLIRLTLRIVGKSFGPRARNQIIKEFNLTKMFGILKAEVKAGKWHSPTMN